LRWFAELRLRKEAIFGWSCSATPRTVGLGSKGGALIRDIRYWIAAAGWAFGTTSAGAQDRLAQQREALALIAQTAAAICTTPPLTSCGQTIELSGGAKAQLGVGISRVAGIGITGAAKYNRTSTQGVLQRDLAVAIRNGNDCKKSVFDTLQAKLLPAPTPTARQHHLETRADATHGASTGGTITGISSSGSVGTQINCVVVINGNNSAETPTVRTCGLSEAQAKEAVRSNLQIAEENLDQLLNAKTDFLFPAMESYRREPSQAAWDVVVDRANTIQGLIIVAVDSFVRIEPSAREKLGTRLFEISQNLNRRGVTIHAFQLEHNPPSIAEFEKIEQTQRRLYMELREELRTLRTSMQI
jgi:hypothetical protein